MADDGIQVDGDDGIKIADDGSGDDGLVVAGDEDGCCCEGCCDGLAADLVNTFAAVVTPPAPCFAVGTCNPLGAGGVKINVWNLPSGLICLRNLTPGTGCTYVVVLDGTTFISISYYADATCASLIRTDVYDEVAIYLNEPGFVECSGGDSLQMIATGSVGGTPAALLFSSPAIRGLHGACYDGSYANEVACFAPACGTPVQPGSGGAITLSAGGC